MHFDAILEVKDDQAIIGNFALDYIYIHDFEELSVGPLSFLPSPNHFALPNQADRGLDRKVDLAEGELQVKLPNVYLGRKFTKYCREVQIFWYAVHSGLTPR